MSSLYTQQAFSFGEERIIYSGVSAAPEVMSPATILFSLPLLMSRVSHVPRRLHVTAADPWPLALFARDFR
jgi:hypothetical protein